MNFYNKGLRSQNKAHFTGIYLIYLLSYNKYYYYSKIDLHNIIHKLNFQKKKYFNILL